MSALDLEQRLERIEAVNAVRNLMGRYALYHASAMHGECCRLSALDTPGVRVEVPPGVYEGREGLERLYRGFFGPLDADSSGRLHVHAMTTPVIEIAGDLETAKGVWITAGHATDRFGGGELEARWRWSRYGADFVREAGEWKIWHLRVNGIFTTPYDKSWVESAAAPGAEPPSPPSLPEAIGPDRPAGPHWLYREDAAFPDDPAPPEPYRSFDEAAAY